LTIDSSSRTDSPHRIRIRVSNRQSEFRKSSIRNRRSALVNLQSSIVNRKSPLV
jgi:hypothetical protein